MQIGKPTRIYTIEPIEDPVPRKPVREPDPAPKEQPVRPADVDARWA
jgi:hypothetical protein